MTDTELIFEDPPVKGKGVVGWLDQIREHPGVWVKFPIPVSISTPAHIRAGRTRGISEGEFEVRAIEAPPENGKRRVWLYARYIGGAA